MSIKNISPVNVLHKVLTFTAYLMVFMGMYFNIIMVIASYYTGLLTFFIISAITYILFLFLNLPLVITFPPIKHLLWAGLGDERITYVEEIPIAIHVPCYLVFFWGTLGLSFSFALSFFDTPSLLYIILTSLIVFPMFLYGLHLTQSKLSKMLS